MVNQISSNLMTKNYQYEASQNIKHNTNSTAVQDNSSDSFASSKAKSSNNNDNTFLKGVTAISIGVAAFTTHKFMGAKKIISSLKNEIDNTHNTLKTMLNFLNEKHSGVIKDSLEKMFDLASKDSMTGLLNKKSLCVGIPQKYSEAMSTNEKFTVAMLDMDNFKSINEVFSHDIGDKFIINIAKNIKNVTKKYNAQAYRYGGEEFVISAKGLDEKSAQKMISEIAENIKKDPILQDHLPDFLLKANKEKFFVENAIQTMNENIFPRLRGISLCKGYSTTMKEMVEGIVNDYITIFKPASMESFNAILTFLKNKDSKDLQKITTGTIVSENETFGGILDKIYNHYKDVNADLRKWVNHVNTHKAFTVTGGIVNVTKEQEFKNPLDLVKIADEVLNINKKNGKNRIGTADSEVISKVLNRK